MCALCGVCRACEIVFHMALVVWRKQAIHFIMLFLSSVLSAAWSHCPVAVWPVVFRKPVHSTPPLTPKFPFFITPHSTFSSSLLSLFLFSHQSIHLFSTSPSLFHDFWPVTMAYKSRFSFWEQKGSLAFFLCCLPFSSYLHAVSCWICEMFLYVDRGKLWSQSVVWSFCCVASTCVG